LQPGLRRVGSCRGAREPTVVEATATVPFGATPRFGWSASVFSDGGLSFTRNGVVQVVPPSYDAVRYTLEPPVAPSSYDR
jgi:hypothetical protein